MKNHQFNLRIFITILFLMVSFVSAFACADKATSCPRKCIVEANLAGSSVTNITICNNQLPYLWNGITCLAAGTFTATLIGSDGSDSLAVLNLSVINVSTSITNAIVCENELPYQWNGNSYSTSGTYSVTLTSSTGCDSVPILSLTINDQVSSNTNSTICSNQLPFNWNGNNYNAAGNYSVTLTSSAGCDSIASLSLTVKPVSTSLTVRTVCSNRLPYIWNGNSYAAAGSYTVPLIAANGCDSVATLQLSVLPVAGSNAFVTICNNQLPYLWNGINYSSSGVYSTILTASNGCDSVPRLTLTVIPVKISTTTITICNAQLPYTWNGNSYSAAGIYSVTLTASNGCDSIATLRLTSLPFLTGSDDVIICNTELPFTWNGNTYPAGGTYSVTLSTTAGCDSIVTLDLTVATPSTGTDSVLLCLEQLPFNWHGQIFTSAGDYPIVPPVVIDDCNSVDLLVITVDVIMPGTTVAVVCSDNLPFSWNGTNYSTSGVYGISLPSSTGCDSLATLNLSVVPVTTSINVVNTCTNQVPFSWNGANYSTSGIYTANLINSGGCDSVATLNLTVSPVATSTTTLSICNTQVPFTWNGNTYSTSGTYVVTLTAGSGCDSLATLQLSVQGVLNSTTNTSICSNQLPYSWNGSTYAGAGSYSVNLISSGGCDSVATLNLIVNDVITSTSNVSVCTNQLPYNWNGNSYSTAGTYTITLITTGGCDSLVTLNLVINDVVSSFSQITVCNNQLPYSWNGNSLPIAGIYLVTLTSSGGCDSLATLDLLVTDILTSTTNVTVCPALLPYQWNGNSYSSGGTYSVTMSTPAGCDSVPILSLTVAPYVESFTSISICTNQLPFTWNGNTYPTAGNYSVLLTGTGACDSLANLNLIVLPPITSLTQVTACENFLPYIWNGNSYPAAGTYNVTLTSSGGCDSIATLVLIVNPVTTSTTNISICNTELPYNWNGNNYLSAGTYTVTFVSNARCDSIATLDLQVNPVVTSLTNISICESQLPYTWNGNVYSASGTYTLTLVSSAGCDSVATLQLAATPVVTGNIVANACEDELPYTWNGNNYSVAGTYSVSLTSSGGCDSIATLNLIVTALSTSTTAVATCQNLLPYDWNGQQYTAAGSYSILLINSGGCDSIATLILSVSPVTTSLTTANTCANELPFIWNGQSFNSTGIYTATLSGSSGCDSTATLNLTVNPINASTSNASTCSAQLPFLWNGQTFTTPGLHVLTLVSSTGCDSLATLNLTINQTPQAPAVVSPVTYCQFAPTNTLTATVSSATGHLVWYTSATGGAGSPSAPLPSSANAGTLNFYVSEVDGPCEGPRTVITVVVNSKPDLGADRLVRVCNGQTANLETLYDTTGFISNWTFGTQPLSNVSAVDTSGTYQLVVQSSAGCLDTALVNVGIQPPVIANAGDDGDAETNIPYQLTGSGGGSYQWSPTGVLNNPFAANPLATLSQDETFILMVSDEIGCFDLDTVSLRVLNGPTFYVPSAFTPNNDGLNDIFRPTPIGIASLNFFRVFNRLGELVYETSEIGKGWDGMYKGKKQNIGNYVWSLKATDRKGKLRIMKGNVVLIR